MIFIETRFFTEDVMRLLTEEDYRQFQCFLALTPDSGDVIPDTGGLRKVRWMSNGKGKSGGVRVIYFYSRTAAQIRLLLIYRKGLKDDLSPQEKTLLRKLNQRW
jgi:hypothetical protein